MEVTINSLSDVQREVEISANADELKPHFDKAYKEYRPKAEIKGFRKGKAPLELVKKMYGDAIEYETLNTIASELYRTVVKEKELRPIGDPVIVDMDYKRGEAFRFKVQYEVRPQIQLKEYKGIEIERPVHAVADEETEEEILRLRKANSTTEEVPAVTDDEHVVTAQTQELDKSGLPLIGKKTQQARFYLGDPQLEQPIRDALKKAEQGGEYRVSFQHQHGDHAHDLFLLLKVAKVEKVKLPDFTNEFVKTITKGKIGTLEEFKKGLSEDLVAYWTEKSRRTTVNALVGELIRRHDFAVPESLTRSILQSLLEEIKGQSQNKQLPPDFDKEQFFQENRAYAIYQAKWALLREEIIKAEKIAVEEKDLMELAERESAKIGIDKERLVTYYKSSDQIQDRMVGDKLIDFLIKNAKIREVEKKEF